MITWEDGMRWLEWALSVGTLWVIGGCFAGLLLAGGALWLEHRRNGLETAAKRHALTRDQLHDRNHLRMDDEGPHPPPKQAKPKRPRKPAPRGPGGRFIKRSE